MNQMWIEAQRYIFDLEVGNGYNDVTLVKRTKKRLNFSNGNIVHIKKLGNLFYLDARGNTINQIVRDVEGYLVYKKLTNHFTNF